MNTDLQNALPPLSLALAMAFNLVWSAPMIHSAPRPPSPGASSGPYKGFGYPWENNALGIGGSLDRSAPKPWTPVAVSGATVEVWGRSFRFGAGPLPEQIVTQGQELLAGPPVITLSANGETLDVRAAKAVIENDGKGDRVTIRWSVGNADVKVAADSTLEFDGFLRVDLAVEPASPSGVRLDSLVIELPLRREAARWFSHAFEYDFVNERSARRGTIINTAGAIDPSTASGQAATIGKPFNHHFWVGGAQGGFEFESPTDVEWAPRAADRAIELVPASETVTFRLNLVNQPKALKQAAAFPIAFYVTPVKPLPPDWRARIAGESLLGFADTTRKQRAIEQFDPKLWMFHTFRPGPGVSLPLERFGMPWPPKDPAERAKHDAKLKEMRAQGVRVIPYSALLGFDSGLPELRDYAPHWLADPAATKIVSPEEAEKKSAGHVYVSLYSKSIQDFLVWTYVTAARECGYDGLYFDLADAHDSVRNPAAGEIDLTGLAGKSYQPVYEMRAFHQRLYRALKAVNPDYLITHHHGKGCYLAAAYADAVYSGEGLNAVFLDRGVAQLRDGQLPAGAPPYIPDYSLFPDDYYLAVYAPPKGCVDLIIPHVVKWNPVWSKPKAMPKSSDDEQRKWYEAHPDIYERYNRGMLARTLALQLPLVRQRMDSKLHDRLMLAFERIGGLKAPLTIFPITEAERFMRVATTPASGGDGRLRAAAYAKPETRKAIVVLANWGGEPLKAEIELDAKALGLADARVAKVTDCEERPAPGLQDGRLRVELPGNDFRMLLVE